MTGPQDHDNAPEKRTDAAHPERSDASPANEPQSPETAPLESKDPALEAAEQWAPHEWEPSTWEPTTPDVLEKLDEEVSQEIGDSLQEQAVDGAQDVADIIAQAEDRAPTSVDATGLAHVTPSAADSSETAHQDLDAEDPDDTNLTARGSWAAALEPTPEQPSSFAPIAPVHGADETLQPLSPFTAPLPSVSPDAAASAQPSEESAAEPATGQLAAADHAEPATEVFAAAAPANPELLADPAERAAQPASGLASSAPGSESVEPEPEPEPAAEPEPTPEPEPTTAQIAAAFPSTPFGRDPRPASQAPSGSEDGAVPDLDATVIHGPLITGAAPQDTYGQAPLAAPESLRRPRGAERKAQKPKTPVWAFLVGAVIAVALIVGGILLATQPWDSSKPGPAPITSNAPTNTNNASPADAIKGFTDATNKGDAAAALGFIASTATAPARNVDDALLTNELYGKTKNRPTAVEVDEASVQAVQPTAIEAKIGATFTQANKSFKTTLRLTREDTSQAWRINPGSLPTITIANASGTTIRVNGMDVKVPGTPGDYVSTGFRVLPGSYDVEGKGDTFTSFDKAKTVNAGIVEYGASSGGTLETVTLKPKRTSAFEDAATKAVDAWLDKCEASTVVNPKNCPFNTAATYQGAKVTDVKWNITKRPQLTFQDYDMGVETVSGSGGTVDITGKAKVNGTSQDIKGTISGFSFRGNLEIKDKKITFEPTS